MAGNAVVEPKKAHQGAHKSSGPSGAGEQWAREMSEACWVVKSTSGPKDW